MTDYEVWSFSLARWDVFPPGPGWTFHCYARLTLLQVLQFENFGYTVRKVIGDRSSTIPLFPLLGPSGEYQDQGLD